MPSHRFVYTTATARAIALAALTFAACDKHEEPRSGSPDGDQSEEKICDGFYPYAPDDSKLEANAPLDLFNTNVRNLGNEVRDQGAIASCASHSILALIENQLFNERGIAVDLAERFMLYANFMHTGTMGMGLDVIRQFPTILARWGAMPEELWRYADIQTNSHRFVQDAAQGLGQESIEDQTVDQAIDGTTCGTKRSEKLTDPDYLGPLPQGDHPIALPIVLADRRVQDGAQIPKYLDVRGARAFAAPCFVKQSDGAPAAPTMVTPREFARLCLDIVPEMYFSCRADLEQVFGRAVPEVEITDPEHKRATCDKGVDQFIARLVEEASEYRTQLLGVVLQLLDHGEAVFVGVDSPQGFGHVPIWWNALAPGGGHAVTVVGYLTHAELLDETQHDRGLLKVCPVDAAGDSRDCAFDDLALAFDSELVRLGELSAVEFVPPVPGDDRETRKTTRTRSRFARLLEQDGGMLFFRNSWGKRAGQIPVGADGYQAMTFGYFVSNAALVLSRTRKEVPADWEPTAGPDFCPLALDRFPPVPHSDPWFAEANETARRQRLEELITPRIEALFPGVFCQP